jgi:site-specific DNA recombinase
MRVLIAARLSKSRGGQTGLDTQGVYSREWAELNGHTVVAVVADRKKGITHPWERPNLRPWMTQPELIAQYDAILGYKIDRLSRGDDESTSLIEQWARDHGKMLLTADGDYYPCEGNDGITWDVKKRVAHQEWLGYSEKYKRMQKHLRDNGFLVGHIPYGFTIVKVAGSEHKTMVPDPEEARFVRQAVERYLTGESLRAVCDWLDAEGADPRIGTKWSCKTLQRIFRNESLIGRRMSEPDKDGKRRTILRHEPILDQEVWDKLQAEMDRKAARKGVAPKDTALLTGIAVCKICGGVMYRIRPGRRRKDGTEYRKSYYRCHGSERNPSKCRNMVPVEIVEAEVDAWVNGPFGDFAWFEKTVIPGHDHADEVAEVDRDIRELDLDSDDYLDRWAALRAERTRLKELPATPAEVKVRPTGLTVRQHWAALGNAARRAFLLELGMVARVRKGEETEITVMGGLLNIRPSTPDALMRKFRQQSAK